MLFDCNFSKNKHRLSLEFVDRKYKGFEQNFFQLRATHDETQHGWCLKNELCVSKNDEHPAIDGHCAWGLKMLNMTKSILESPDANR